MDVPFTNGEFNTQGAFIKLNVDDIECDESIWVFNNNKVDSINLKNAIVQSILPFKSPEDSTN